MVSAGQGTGMLWQQKSARDPLCVQHCWASPKGIHLTGSSAPQADPQLCCSTVKQVGAPGCKLEVQGMSETFAKSPTAAVS